MTRLERKYSTIRKAVWGAAVLFAAACSGGGTDVAPPPPPPPPPPVVASITVTPPSPSVAVAQTIQLAATPKDAAGNTVSATVSWTSADASRASVSAAGLVTGVSAGTTTVTASSGTVTRAVTVTVTPAAAQNFDHVFIIVLENRDYGHVIGNSSWAYLNSLAQQNALATQYTSNTHPSIGNYFYMTTGDTVSNNDTLSAPKNVDNVVRRLVAAGKTWTSYAENLPSVGYIGPDQGRYSRHRNIFTLLTDVTTSQAQRQNLQPFTQFAPDLAAGRMANYVFLVPNSCNDGHDPDCTDAQADTWVRNNIDPLINSALFQQNSLLIVTFDESETWASTNGGWRIPWILVSPRGKKGYASSTAYDHGATLRLSLEALGVSGFPGHAASAPDMKEFFSR